MHTNLHRIFKEDFQKLIETRKYKIEKSKQLQKCQMLLEKSRINNEYE